MAKLELEVVGYNNALNSLTINGKKVKLKKNKNKNNTRSCFVEAENAEVVVCKTHNYIGKNWFWWNLLYYLVSIFGIFDFNNNKRCLIVDFRCNLKLEKDSKVVMKINNFEDGGRFAELGSGAENAVETKVEGETENESKTEIVVEDKTLSEVENNVEIEEVSNISGFDKTGQARHKKMKKIKLAISLVTMVLTALILVFVVKIGG